MQSPSANWLIAKRGVQTNPDAIQLLCLPQAGMGAWAYQTWSERLAPEIQVLPVELPGHGVRMREPRVTDLCELSCQIVDALDNVIRSGPYALFGHSMGAWIVWEMVQEISRRGLPLPLKLFVSSNRAPHLCGVEHDVDRTRLHKLAPAEFWQAMERRYGPNPNLVDPDVRSFMYPMLIDDFTLVETYKPSAPNKTTKVPVTAIGAKLDNRYTPKQIQAWKQHTTGQFLEYWLDDLGHNYTDKAPDSLLTSIKAQLLSPESTTATGAAHAPGCLCCCYRAGSD